jgi:hypothetical protein
MTTRLAIVVALLVPLTPVGGQRPEAPPRLVLHLTLDQARPDFLAAWGPEYRAGFRWLLDHGVLYTRGEQDHASTETAPGHATLLSGRWPASTGILTNNRGVPDPLVQLVDARGPGASPREFRGTTLYDWMRAADPATRALSVSYKDRGAILPIGRAAVPVFWYADGKFTTSTWYGDQLPEWVAAWNAGDPVGRLAGYRWELSRPRGEYPETDDRPFENGGRDHTFPHVLGQDRATAIHDIQYFPVFDSLTLDLAWRGVRALGLGQRDGTDLLAVSLSISDKLGHRYGPGSLEVHDHYLQLDRHLGWFLDSLATIVPRDRMIVSLAADHGGTEFPESGHGGRIRLLEETRDLNAWAWARWGIRLGADEDRGLVFADLAALTARGVSVDSLREAFADRVRQREGVRRVYTPASLAATADADAMMWRRLIPADTEWLVAVSLDDGWLWTSVQTITDHGSTNLDDVRIPILLTVPGVSPAVVGRPVGAVDIAPTLAALLGISPTEPLDGQPLFEVVGDTRKP